ncbi:MAG TPA: transglycosylase domain-containing protein [Gordonia sp. (in: high G+C Gram-positive bacteria)]|uniref:transglycosylase domain-containing protein n=1 Tax=unclassified Gordonia (in: high G+C Gram-positive bacteria) TaxID=2657482 RepID=UPI000FB680DA|nr:MULTISPECIES: transglycosylase domain-containing protein [unclassified Gordonia (in: high G+C Gram-positive bacteria)]RUP37398.1 MAG: penicillin-binding protein [Gordonia sp. (in: high G+C Gram-positive bacteria)]HNP57592.1 transglycosylase domain-containing protein [Gordonia sp. (in: high G+C Gram-positive bacteria)]HRC50222.1 transglycosylase domain-containing protein [Gordonia sp. (in: high G+C Gram-positive bacteria)]
MSSANEPPKRTTPSSGTTSGSAASKSLATAKEKATAAKQKRIAWGVGFVGAFIPVIAVIGILAFLITYVFAHVPASGEIKHNQVANILYADGSVMTKVIPPEGNRTDVKITDIPISLQEAVIAAEDREFRSNSGFSIRGLSRAVVGKLTGREDAGGGSTITQQYVKNALVGDEHSYKRKFVELAMATKMSNEWTKDDIMAAYLNTIYFGRGAYGVAAASQAYFRKDVRKLTTEESAVLAASIRSPANYDPQTNPELARQRWDYVLDGMVSIGAITQAERDTMKYPKVVKYTEGGAQQDDGPMGLVKRQVLAELGTLNITEQQVRTDGLKITTTIKKQNQKALVDAAKSKLADYPKTTRTGIVSIDPSTGGISGYYGGTDGQGWDYASAGLQTGSSFKVFALVAALEQDIPLSKIYSSSEYEGSGGLVVKNSDGESCGSCNLATAMKMSLNTVYYRLMMDLRGQAQAVADAAHKAGIAESFGDIAHTLQESNGGVEGGVVLGQYVSRVLDMASAYATLAASGIYRQPHFVTKVETNDGTVLFNRKPDPGKRVFAAKVADNVTAALEPIAGYSNGNSLYDPTYGYRPSAAKTGTAQLGDTGQNKDAWMVGYTPQLSTAVWVGTDKGTALKNSWGGPVYGSGVPAQIWKASMDGALEGQPIKQFPTPEAVGGQAGVPYEAPPPPPATKSRSRDRDRPRLPGEGEDGNITVAPGITIPAPGGRPQQRGRPQPNRPQQRGRPGPRWGF